MSDVESVERVIAAPAEVIFELLADPRHHHEIDGSGTVRDAKDPRTEDGPNVTRLGVLHE